MDKYISFFLKPSLSKIKMLPSRPEDSKTWRCKHCEDSTDPALSHKKRVLCTSQTSPALEFFFFKIYNFRKLSCRNYLGLVHRRGKE